MNSKIFLLLIIASIGLFSCDEDYELNKTVIDEIIFHENVDQVGKYIYNRDGSVKRYEFHFDNKFLEYTDYLYSGNKLITRNYYEKRSDGNFTIFAHDTFAYNSEEQLTQAILNEDSPGEAIYELTWDGSRVSRIDYTTFSSGVAYQSFYTIVYDERGNATTITYFYLDGGQQILNFILECEYDDHVNPLAELSAPYEYLLAGPNNVIRQTQRSSVDDVPYAIHDIEYDYNELDMPVQKNEQINLHGDISNIQVKYLYKKI